MINLDAEQISSQTVVIRYVIFLNKVYSNKNLFLIRLHTEIAVFIYRRKILHWRVVNCIVPG